jgi:hypothetical protein
MDVPKDPKGLWNFIHEHEGNLACANLRGARLTRFNFGDADLTGADFTDADLEQADFSEAKVSRANFTGAALNRADFSGTTANEADFTRATAIGADFAHSSLRKAKFISTELERANFTEANLSEADLSEAHLTDTVLARTNLEGTLLGAMFIGTIVVAVRLARAKSLDRAYIDGFSVDQETLKFLIEDVNAGIPSETAIGFLRDGGIVLPEALDSLAPPSSASREPHDFLPDFLVPNSLPTPAVVQELRNVLEQAQGEREMQEFLEQHPEVLAACVAAHHWGWVIPQKRLGSEYVTDFLVCGRSSLGVEWVAVELESPTVPLFTQAGDVSQTLNHAIRQIRDWRDWLANNLDYARRSREQNGLGLREISAEVPGLILIGRRSRLDAETKQHRRRIGRESNMVIHTYDFLVDACTRWTPGGLLHDPGAPD